MKKKIKDPIPLEKIIEYYTTEEGLMKSKTELLSELNDVLTIMKFGEDNPSYYLKSVSQQMNDFFKNLKKLRGQLQKSLIEPLKLQRTQKLSLNPQIAYDLVCRLSSENEERDFKEDFVQKQMKLKFLSSRGLPKKISWKNTYNVKQGQLILASNKHQLYIGLGLRPGAKQYHWQIIKIEEISRKKQIQFLKFYFDDQMRPILEKKYPQGYENYSLRHMIILLQFVQLIQLHRHVSQVALKYADNKYVYLKKGAQYLVQFSSPGQSQIATFSLQIKGVQNFRFEICFEMKCSKAKIMYNNNEFICNEFNLANFINLTEKIPILLALLDKLEKGQKREPFFFKEMKKYILIKWNGYTWHSSHNCKLTSEIASAIFQEGIYVINIFKGKLIKLNLSKRGKVISDDFNEEFLKKLITKTSKVSTSKSYSELIFTFLFIIRYFQDDTENPDCFHIIEYHILKPSNPRIPGEQEIDEEIFLIKFKRRALLEDFIHKSLNKQHPCDNNSIYILTLKIEFDLNLTSMELLPLTKDQSLPLQEIHKIPEYLQMIENKIPGQRVNIDICIKQINSLRSQATLRKMIEKRFGPDFRLKTEFSI